MHADIREPAAQDQRLDLQPLEKDLEIGSEKGRVPTLGNLMVAGAKPQLLLGDLGPGVPVETMEILVAVQFPPKVDQVGPMHLLDKDHRDVVVMRSIDQVPGRQHAILIARHVIDRADGAVVDEGAFLDIDDDQGGAAFDEGARRFTGVRHFSGSMVAAGPAHIRLNSEG